MQGVGTLKESLSSQEARPSHVSRLLAMRETKAKTSLF